MTDKHALRAMLRERRDAMVRRDLPVSDAFINALAPGRTVASYVPVGGEADPAALVESALAAGCSIALPHVASRSEPMRFLLWRPGEPLVRGAFGLMQPKVDAPQAEPDVILTPLVGFDRCGNRIGQGAGFYDRAFVAHPAAWRVGVAWSVQEVGKIDPDPWDVPLHAIATEKEWITP